MIELSTIRDIVAIFGVLAGFSYYVLTVRNTEKARKIQLITQITNLTDEYNQKRARELLTLGWTDYDDFERKYGSDFNLEAFGKKYATWSSFNTIGYYLKEGLIDIKTIQEITGGQMGPSWMWDKYEPIILEQRVRYKMPKLFDSWEYLVKELKKYYEKMGYTDIMDENYGSYKPDKYQSVILSTHTLWLASLA